MILDKALALITGGATGLGKTFAKTLLQRGANVVIADIDRKSGVEFENETLEEHGENRLKFVECDVLNVKALKETFDYTKEQFGRLDIVCNNAGIMTADVSRSSEQVSLNLGSLIEGTYKGIDVMSRQNGGEGGVVINLSSGSGFNVLRGHAVYTATKFGVVGFTRSFKFLEHRDIDGVRVNCLCPYFVDTEMTRKAMEESAEVAFQLEAVGFTDVDDVAKAFMMCIEDKDMNGESIAIHRPHSIYQLKFRQPIPVPPAQGRNVPSSNLFSGIEKQ